MTHYAIRDRKTGDLLDILGATTALIDDSSPVSSTQRTMEVEPALLVGRFGRQPIFATSDLDLVRFLMLTKVGNEHRNYILLDLAHDMTLEDLECVDLATMAAVDIGADTLDTKALISEKVYQDVREKVDGAVRA